MEIERIEEVADVETGPSKTNVEGLRERKKNSDETAKKLLSVEEIFESVQVPSWKKQLTCRALVVGAALGILMSVIVMKLNLTTGIIPSLNISAGLLGFFLIKSWTKVIESCGLLKQPFTRQENTVIQTCVVACADIAFSGGFGSYMLGMSKVVADQSKGEKYIEVNTKEPSLAWIIPFLFAVSFVGLFSIVPLRKIMILGYRLTYPSGTATAHLINSFHTPHGGKIAMKQVYMLLKTLLFSFLWDFFQWFFTGGDGCGFASFPTFGLKAYENSFYFDFSATYVGVGMICPYIINFSLFLGSVISWGILWPYIAGKKGIWYDENAAGMRGIQGYKVFISIAIILGDGLFQFLLVVFRSAYDIYTKRKNKDSTIPLANQSSPDDSLEAQSFDDHRRTKAFLQDQIPIKVAIGGYILLALISILTVPRIFPELKFYHIIVIYLMAPVLAFCNTYGAGLTDWSLASSYGKLAIFILGSWIGAANGGLLASLAACGVMMSIVTTASDLMQDFKTGYLTLSSPLSMFISQVIGTAMGCVIGPSVFWLFYKAFSLGAPNSQYPAPFATIYRSIGSLATEGVGALPKYCVHFCIAFFFGAFVFNLVKEIARCNKWKVHKFIPSAMGMAIPFYIGSYFTIDMCIGSLIVFLWEWRNKTHADMFVAPFASGLICGEGLWSLPASVLAIFKINPPLCMMVLSRADTAKLATVLGS